MFKVKLKDGQTLELNNECNSVNYEDANMVVFKRIFEDRTYRALAIIPRENILFIEQEEEKE